MLSRQTTLGLFLIAVALLYEFFCRQSFRQDSPEQTLVAELAGVWEREIQRPSHMPQKIAVGYVDGRGFCLIIIPEPSQTSGLLCCSDIILWAKLCPVSLCW